MIELARRFLTNSSSVGPADPIAIEQFSTNGVQLGEERLMLAVLQDAVDCFQEHVLAQYIWEKKLFQDAEDWIFDKNTDWPFRLRISVKFAAKPRLYTSRLASLEGSKAQDPLC
jgi:hypothetical protein